MNAQKDISSSNLLSVLDLPTELCQRIFLYLLVSDISSIALTCKAFMMSMNPRIISDILLPERSIGTGGGCTYDHRNIHGGIRSCAYAKYLYPKGNYGNVAPLDVILQMFKRFQLDLYHSEFMVTDRDSSYISCADILFGGLCKFGFVEAAKIMLKYVNHRDNSGGNDSGYADDNNDEAGSHRIAGNYDYSHSEVQEKKRQHGYENLNKNNPSSQKKIRNHGTRNKRTKRQNNNNNSKNNKSSNYSHSNINSNNVGYTNDNDKIESNDNVDDNKSSGSYINYRFYNDNDNSYENMIKIMKNKDSLFFVTVKGSSNESSSSQITEETSCPPFDVFLSPRLKIDASADHNFCLQWAVRKHNVELVKALCRQHNVYPVKEVFVLAKVYGDDKSVIKLLKKIRMLRRKQNGQNE